MNPTYILMFMNAIALIFFIWQGVGVVRVNRKLKRMNDEYDAILKDFHGTNKK